MNNKSRKQIESIITQLTDINETLADLKEQIQTLADDEQEKLDNMEERFGETERFYNVQEIQEYLQSAADSDDIEEIIDNLESAVQ